MYVCLAFRDKERGGTELVTVQETVRSMKSSERYSMLMMSFLFQKESPRRCFWPRSKPTTLRARTARQTTRTLKRKTRRKSRKQQMRKRGEMRKVGDLQCPLAGVLLLISDAFVLITGVASNNAVIRLMN